MYQPSNFIDAVGLFMSLGGQTTNEFNPEQACLYVGLQLEELAEKLTAIKGGALTSDAAKRFDDAIGPMLALSEAFKRGEHRGDLMRADPQEVLDGDLDLAVVAIGGAFSYCTDAASAARTVTAANLAKFPNGQAIRDEQGKIRKPAGWRAPDLKPFLPQLSDDFSDYAYAP